MKTYNVNDENFLNSELYKNFINTHPSKGNLRIRAYAANGAVPISGLKVVVSTNIENNKVIFFEGVTDDSGLIDRISLPAYKLDLNNLDIPDKTVYEINATYSPNNLKLLFSVNIYENVCVVQNINIVPDTKIIEGDLIGS